MSERASAHAAARILTLANLLSFARILLIPVFVYLIMHEGTERAGLLLFAVVAATDWVDGYAARRLDQVTDLGRILDPTADRLAIAAGLIALVAAGAFPLWAALLVLVRDAAILVAGAVLLLTGGSRIEVRFIGKVATFGLMVAITLIAWGNLGLPLAAAAKAMGWAAYSVAIVEYYAATVLYVGDLRRAFAGSRRHRAVAKPGDGRFT
jgi:cardiolipin synthase